MMNFIAYDKADEKMWSSSPPGTITALQPARNEFKVDRWLEKVQTASAVGKVINDYLFMGFQFAGQ
jgi:hypothetical protein